MNEDIEILIIVEGTSDKAFMEKIVEKISPSQSQKNILITTALNRRSNKEAVLSCNNLLTIINEPKHGSVKKILLLCDADYAKRNAKYSGFKKTKNTLDLLLPDLKEECSREIEIKYYIFPDNHNDGNLETLFLKSISKDLKQSLICVENYFECLKVIPKDKTKAHTLITAIGGNEDIFTVEYAATDKFFNFNSLLITKLTTFLKNFLDI